jgi:hypothetical protein
MAELPNLRVEGRSRDLVATIEALEEAAVASPGSSDGAFKAPSQAKCSAFGK